MDVGSWMLLYAVMSRHVYMYTHIYIYIHLYIIEDVHCLHIDLYCMCICICYILSRQVRQFDENDHVLGRR